jgi:hypothetical protein
MSQTPGGGKNNRIWLIGLSATLVEGGWSYTNDDLDVEKVVEVVSSTDVNTHTWDK